MKVAIVWDEWYPVYWISQEKWAIKNYGTVEVDEELLDELERATRHFSLVQEKLRLLDESARTARLSAAQRRAERRS